MRPEETTGKVDTIAPWVDTVIAKMDTVKIRNTDSSLFASKRFGETDIYALNELEVKEGQYREADDYMGRSVKLGYTFRAPANDTMKYRPFVLLLHEGALVYGDRWSEDGKAKWLSRKGYATATINYRVGFNGATNSNACGGNNMEVYQAFYRGTQDVNVALHYFMDNAEKFGIDPRNVIVAGSSAGGMIASAHQFMTELDFEKLRPGMTKVLGKLDPYSDRSPFRVKGILTSLGYAIIQKSYITSKNAKPILFFHRRGDDVLAFETGRLYYCPDYFYTEGSKNVSDRLRELKMPFELNYEPTTGHALSYSEEYIAGRYAAFVKRLWGNDRRELVFENYTLKENIKLP